MEDPQLAELSRRDPGEMVELRLMMPREVLIWLHEQGRARFKTRAGYVRDLLIRHYISTRDAGR